MENYIFGVIGFFATVDRFFQAFSTGRHKQAAAATAAAAAAADEY